MNVKTADQRDGNRALNGDGSFLSYLCLTLGPVPMADERITTVVSTKGQVILPKAIRQARHWEPGTCLVVEDTADGVLLRTAPVFAPTRPEDVFASLAYAGPPKTLEDMEAGIAAEARRRHAGDRH